MRFNIDPISGAPKPVVDLPESSGNSGNTAPRDLLPPSPIIIVDQAASSAGGSVKIDVTIEFPDVPGAVDYEVRWSKV